MQRISAGISKVKPQRVPEIPILLMSGYVSPALTARARDAGVLDVLGKPLVARDIAAGLARALQR